MNRLCCKGILSTVKNSNKFEVFSLTILDDPDGSSVPTGVPSNLRFDCTFAKYGYWS